MGKPLALKKQHPSGPLQKDKIDLVEHDGSSSLQHRRKP